MTTDTLPSPPPRGRLAPSPTGRLHLGNAFAFLMAWLSIRRQKGKLVLRIEDIDPQRSRPEYVRAIMDDLQWLGLDWDEGPDKPSGPDKTMALSRSGPYVQSLRFGRYEEIIAGLQRRGLVYPCYCTRRELRMLASAPHVGDEGAPYPGTCRTLSEGQRRELEEGGRRPSLRLDTGAAARELGGGTDSDLAVCFCDAVLGEQTFTMADCGGDFALRRSDGVYAYQLAVVADDADMGITEVVRGDDLLLSTPRQLLLFRLLGKEPPRYAHVPLLHDAAGERLAKRHKSLELATLRHAAVRPREVLAYLGTLAGCLPCAGDASLAVPELLAKMTAGFSLAALKGRNLQIDGTVFGKL